MREQPRGLAVHLAAVVAIIGGVLLFTYYPFMGGTHDALAVGVSLMAQIAGVVGLLFIPLGLVWLGHDFRAWSQEQKSLTPTTLAVGWGAALLVVSSIVVASVAIAAFAEVGLLLGIAVLVVWALVLYRAITARGFIDRVGAKGGIRGCGATVRSLMRTNSTPHLMSDPYQRVRSEERGPQPTSTTTLPRARPSPT